MTTIPVELRPVLSMILNALDRDAQEGKPARGEMADELRALLSEQPQAGAGPALIGTLRKSFPLLEEEGLDEFVHCCERHIQRERKRLHAIIDAALTHSPKGEEE